MDMGQFVCYAIGLESQVLTLAENLDLWLNKTYDVRTGRRSTVSTDDDPILELDGHNGCLDNAPLPNQPLHPRCGIWGNIRRG
jgi:hypothetical protein